MDHPTTSISEDPKVTAIVLVGPPASGKTTVRQLISDYDVVGCDLDSHHEDGRVVDDGWINKIEDVVRYAEQTKPYVCCVEGAITDEQVDAVREKTAGTLVIRVEAPDRPERVQRYISREIDELEEDDDTPISEEAVAALRSGIAGRHQVEAPYPKHAVSIYNSDDVSTTELSDRCGEIVGVVSGSDTSQPSMSSPPSDTS